MPYGIRNGLGKIEFLEKNCTFGKVCHSRKTLCFCQGVESNNIAN